MVKSCKNCLAFNPVEISIVGIHGNRTEAHCILGHKIEVNRQKNIMHHAPISRKCEKPTTVAEYVKLAKAMKEE